MSASLSLIQRVRQSLGVWSGASPSAEAASPQGLPVNLGGYEFAKASPTAAAGGPMSEASLLELDAVQFIGPLSVVGSTLADHAEAVVREAVSNAVRHAHAGTVSVTVRVEDDFSIEVVDDGCGMPDEVTPSGLNNLRRRAAEMGETDFAYEACPVVFWDVFGEGGHPLRATVAEAYGCVCSHAT